MTGFFKVSVLGLFVLLLSNQACADEEIESLIDLAQSNGKVIAVIRGTRSIAARLRPGEDVLWSDSSGHLAAFLTQDRFFVISIFSGAWRALRLKIDEPGKFVADLSPFLALLVSRNRAIGFNLSSNKFVQTRLPLHEKILATEIEKYVAVVVTTGRAYGLSANSSSFAEIRLRVKESVEDVTATSSKVTIRTSDRLLSFVARGSRWREHRLK